MAERKKLGGSGGDAGALSHCPGTKVALNRRHGAGEAHAPGRSWGNCWRCGQPLGCSICTTQNAAEVFCVRCLAWGTLEAFEHHGPMEKGPGARVGARYGEYPHAWRTRIGQ